jgi:hypothetical protein
MEKRRQPEIIAGRVNSDGTIASSVPGDSFTVVKGGAGVYTLNFASGFRLIGLTITKVGSDTPFYLGTPTERSCQVTSVSTIGGAGIDIGFCFTASGLQI